MVMYFDFSEVLTFSDSEVGLLLLFADIGIVLKIYTDAAHFQQLNRCIQMIDNFSMKLGRQTQFCVNPNENG